MRIISLMPVGQVDHALLEPLAEGLTRHLRVACSIQPDRLEPGFAFNPQRRQYHSTEILKKIVQRPSSEAWKVLGVTEMDLDRKSTRLNSSHANISYAVFCL